MSRLPVNSRILEYKITGNLGSGGFAHTYQALDTNLDKIVAIKEFFPARLCARGEAFRVAPQPGAEERFTKYLNSFVEEARILAKFDEPNIVKVLRYFEALGTAYIIMEFVDGRPMSDYFAFDHVLGEERVSRWLTGILKGLKAVHEADVIHGDIKPRNILITEADEAVLIDFGASVIYKAAQQNAEPIDELHLSRNYAAPEQFVQGAKLDHRLDLYGLGAVFYQAITGEKVAEVTAAGTDVAVEVLRYKRFYNQKLLASVARSLQFNRDARFDDAGEWLNAITLSSGETVQRAFKRHRRVIAASLLLVSLLAYGAYYVDKNDIDEKNYHYKIFASQEEVVEKLRSADEILAKLQAARSYLLAYANEYMAQVAKIEEGDLPTGRNTLASLREQEAAVGAPRAEIDAAIVEIQSLRDSYYFDDLATPLNRVNEKIKAFGDLQPELNTLLFAAYVEAEIVREGRREVIVVDQGQLAELITSIRSGERLEDLSALVPAAAPIIDGFLQQQRQAEERRRFEVTRQQTLEKIKDLAEPLRKNSRFQEFSAAQNMVRQAERQGQLDLAMKTAQTLAADIKSEQRRAAERRVAQRRASERRTLVNSIDASMISVPPGEFTMGSNRHGYARPPHSVKVHAFFIQRHEVTAAQWSECVRDSVCPAPAAASGGADFPVTGITWDAAQAFVEWVNGTSPRFRYRLVSEAEWEYVAKKYGFVVRELQGALSSVTVQEANKLGVNSILGNALEWLEDCWHGGYVGAPQDSRAWVRGFECSRRVVRGANWEGDYKLTQDNATYFRPAGVERAETRPTLGFRLAGERK